jgi:transposase
VVESTYNWYWLVDLLQENGYRVHLANPAAIQKYAGQKHVDASVVSLLRNDITTQPLKGEGVFLTFYDPINISS